MRTVDLELIARSIVADGRGILAADETPGTLSKRFSAHGIESTPDSRRAYRELFITTKGIAEYIGGVILQDETIRQRSSAGLPLTTLLNGQGICAGIKVDHGAKPLAGCPGERITEGLDGLPQRLEEYYAMGARFAKWRAVLTIADGQPSIACVRANAHVLARYAAMCQEAGLLPIVEPEVLMDGSHSLERCEEVTAGVLQVVFDELFEQRVRPEGMLLKPNMVLAGGSCPDAADPDAAAEATLRCLRRHVPAAVPGIVFLSGGQDPVAAMLQLSIINQQADTNPWTLTFCYERALQDEALTIWKGREGNVAAAQRAFYNRARCGVAAALGRYSAATEVGPTAA